MIDLIKTHDEDGNPIAKCAEDWVDPELFFEPSTAELAISICRQCPIVTECLAYALRNKLEDGVWGGMTEVQRKQWRKKRLRSNQDAKANSR